MHSNYRWHRTTEEKISPQTVQFIEIATIIDQFLAYHRRHCHYDSKMARPMQIWPFFGSISRVQSSRPWRVFSCRSSSDALTRSTVYISVQRNREMITSPPPLQFILNFPKVLTWCGTARVCEALAAATPPPQRSKIHIDTHPSPDSTKFHAEKVKTRD